MPQSKVDLTIIKGEEILQHLETLAKLRIQVFKDFPYLYQGSLDYEKEYLKVYCEGKDSMVALATLDQKVIGATTGTAISNEPDEVKIPFLNNDYPLDKVFYFGESVLLKEYRGMGIGWKFMQSREQHAQSLGYHWAVFCGVERASDHPRRPDDYQPLNKFWEKAGFRELGLSCYFEWQDLDEDQNSPKKMNFWGKGLTESFSFLSETETPVGTK